MTANPDRDKAGPRARALRRLLLLLALLGLLPGLPALADDAVSHQRYRLGGVEVPFTVTAGTLSMGGGERGATLFYVAYARDGVPADGRPVTFVFNGGPGASSAYLHLGALGPRILEQGPDGQFAPATQRLADNPDTWLDLSDLVFIDPVGTGYSRGDRRYWSVGEDLNSFADFIESYLKKNARLSSPKYLVGESYGGFRAARLPDLLASDHGIALAGSFLISPMLETSLRSSDSLALLPDALILPSYAAVALERTMTPTPASLAEVEHYALGPYITALANPRNEVGLRAMYAQVARYVGLPEALVTRYGGRVPLGVFTKEIRRGEKLIVSRYDGSVSVPDPYPATSRTAVDPIYDTFGLALSGTVEDYLRTLGVQRDETYRVSNGEVSRSWNWRPGRNPGDGDFGASSELREALAANRSLKIVIAHGMTDLVTPYLASRYVIDHLPAGLTDGHVSIDLYPGGHMMYLRPVTRARLHADAARLYPAPPL
ncbi:MAG TPA: hypothetical protein VMI56_09205 [Reyranella sp.]|nr:hypothetical protein [Reyranella sp.]